MHTVTVDEAQARLPELIARARAGEEVIILPQPGDSRAVKLELAVGLPNGAGNVSDAGLIGFLAGKIELRPGWDEPLEEMRPYAG